MDPLPPHNGKMPTGSNGPIGNCINTDPNLCCSEFGYHDIGLYCIAAIISPSGTPFIPILFIGILIGGGRAGGHSIAGQDPCIAPQVLQLHFFCSKSSHSKRLLQLFVAALLVPRMAWVPIPFIAVFDGARQLGLPHLLPISKELRLRGCEADQHGTTLVSRARSVGHSGWMLIREHNPWYFYNRTPTIRVVLPS